MNTNEKAIFEIPTMEIRRFACEDIITTSTIGNETQPATQDGNQGEWDPQ